MTPEGYPDEDELQKIRTWPAEDPLGLMAYVRERWYLPDWGWEEGPGADPEKFDAAERDTTVFQISTAGWSGNEDIIAAMQANTTFWTLHWWSSRRGGHYELRIRPLGQPTDDQRLSRLKNLIEEHRTAVKRAALARRRLRDSHQSLSDENGPAWKRHIAEQRAGQQTCLVCLGASEEEWEKS